MRRRDIPHSRERILRRRNLALQNYTLVVFGIALFVGTAAWILSDERIRISNVDISGNIVIQDYEIEEHINNILSGKYLFLFPRDSVFLYPKETIINSVANDFKRIETFEITLKHITTLSVNLKEREGYALWCGDIYVVTPSNKTCYFLDNKGYIFAEAPYFTGNAYFEFYGGLGTTTVKGTDSTLPTGKNYRTPEEFQKIVLLKDSFSRLGVRTFRVTSLPFGDYELFMDEGGKILWNIKRDPLAVVSDFEAAYQTEMGDVKDLNTRKKIDYVDLRFENKVFFKKK